jgi:hypothetical protein
MALMEFKRIPRFTTEEVQQAQAFVNDRLLPTLLDIPTSEWDEYLEPEDTFTPLPLTDIATEWTADGICPECFGARGPLPGTSWEKYAEYWQGVVATLKKIDPHYDSTRSPRSGHLLTCSRWKRYWPKKG